MSRTDKTILFCCGFFLFLLTALHIHGFSITYWHKVIDQSAESEIIFGASRGIRGDDFIIELPLALSQSQSPKPFSSVNENIGTGARMGIPFKVPVLTPLLFFQPVVWGYFINDNIGMAFNWWIMVFGTFLSVYGLTRTFTKSSEGVALTAALSFLVSPYIQFWSYHVTEIFIFGTAAVLSFITLIRKTNDFSRLKKMVLCLFSGWSLGAFLTCFVYPPFLITLGYVLLGFFISWSLQNTSTLQTFVRKSSNWYYVIAIFGIFLTAGLLLKHVSSDAIDLISKTTYPGKRFLTGGNVSVWQFFLDQIYTQVEFIRLKNWGNRDNICEAASFVLFSPVIFLIYIYSGFKNKSFPTPLIPLFALWIVFGIYTNLGLPPILSQWTLLSKVPDKRTLFAIGVIDFLALIYFFKDEFVRSSLSKSEKVFFCCAHLLLLALTVILVRQQVPQIRLWMMIPGFLVQSFLILFLLFSVKKLKYFFLISTFSMAPYTLAFNPIVRGGTEFIRNNNLAKAMQSHSKSKPTAKWAVLALADTPEIRVKARNLANYPRMIGVPSVGGYMCPPQMDFINDLELPAKLQAEINQCAYNTFLLSQNKDEPLKVEAESGMLVYKIAAHHPFFTAQKVDFFLGVGALPESFKIDGFEKTFEEKSLSIWSRKNL